MLTKRRQAGAVVQVWEYGATLTLGPSARRTLIVRPDDPFDFLAIPDIGGDYTVTAGAAFITVPYTSGNVFFLEINAGGAGCTIAGPAAAPDGGIRVRARPLTVVSETTVESTLDTSASVALYSAVPGADIPITLAVGGWPEIDPIQAEAVCNAWVARYQNARPLVTISVRNADRAHLDQIVPNVGIAADAWINALQVRVSGPGGQTVELVLGCELCDTVQGGVWDTAVWDHPAAIWGV
jgi:hypothetical protein